MKYHVVSGDSPAGSLKYYFKENNISDIIINHFDDLSVGPIHTDFEERLAWIGNRLFPWENAEDTTEIIQHARNMRDNYAKYISNLQDEDEVYIWYGDNVIEDMMLYRMCYDIEKGHIHTIYVGKYKNSYGHFPRHVGECSPEDLGKILETSSKLPDESKQAFANYYREIIEEKGFLRIEKNGEVQTVDQEYYDEEMLKLTPDTNYTPAPRVIGDVMGYSNQVVSDSFLQYRLKYLIDEGKIVTEGKLDTLRDFKIKKCNSKEELKK